MAHAARLAAILNSTGICSEGYIYNKTDVDWDLGNTYNLLLHMQP